MFQFFIFIQAINFSLTTSWSSEFLNQYNFEDNIEKYWNYRDRLEKFIWMAPGGDHLPVDWAKTHHGSYLPAKFQNDDILEWGDTGEHLGIYIQVMATEYRLMKDYGMDYHPSLYALSNVMYAIERLDMFAELFYRNKQDCGDSGTLNPEDINGFLLRDDVFPETNENNPAWGYINTINSEYISANEGSTSNSINKSMSQDHVWHILVGLSLVVELVDDPEWFVDSKGDSTQMNNWARRVGERLIRGMHGYDALFINSTCPCDAVRGANRWLIRNPVNCGVSAKSKPVDLSSYSKYFAKAGKIFAGKELSWSTMEGPPVGQYNEHFKACGKLSLSAIADWYPNLDFLNDYCNNLNYGCLINIINWYIENCLAAQNYKNADDFPDREYGFEHLPFVYWVLHRENEDIYDKVAESAEQGFLMHVAKILNDAPYCGPFNYGNLEQIDMYSSRHWASQTLLSKPHRTTDVGITTEYGLGDYHGLDYMALHNLFWLTVLDKYTLNKYVVEDILTKKSGKNNKSTRIEAYNKIIATNEIKAGGSASYEARQIHLLPGFHVNKGASFRATPTGQPMNTIKFGKKEVLSSRCTEWPPSVIPEDSFSEKKLKPLR